MLEKIQIQMLNKEEDEAEIEPQQMVQQSKEILQETSRYRIIWSSVPAPCSP